MVELREKRKVVLGITGSIAAYKSAELARLLISRGYAVRVIMTEAAQEFITQTTMEALSGNPVVTDIWDQSETTGIGHIQLADWADAIVVAPATADTIAKINAGFAESALLATILATKAPLLIAPAMNCNMFDNVQTQKNISELREKGVWFVDPEEGELACGWKGSGRLASSWEIFFNIRKILSVRDFEGKHVLITTGPTREPIDPVRSLSNRSSGKMGVALAREVYRRGAQITLIHGPVEVNVPSAVHCIPVLTAKEMHEAVMHEVFEGEVQPDIVIMAAAVADFRPIEFVNQKIKKSSSDKALSIELESNPDILSDLGERRVEKKPLLVGFAVETGELEDLIAEARDKMERKGADMIVGNFAEDAFDLDTNRVWILNNKGKQEEVSTSFKSRVANKILDAIYKY